MVLNVYHIGNNANTNPVFDAALSNFLVNVMGDNVGQDCKL